MTIQDTKECSKCQHLEMGSIIELDYAGRCKACGREIHNVWADNIPSEPTIPRSVLEKYISEKIDLYSYEDDDNYYGRVEAYQDLLTFIKKYK